MIPGPPIEASRALKVDPTLKRVLTGRKSNMITIMIGKMEMVFPDMYLKLTDKNVCCFEGEFENISKINYLLFVIVGKRLTKTNIMNKFIGACLMGPRAISQDLLAFRPGSVCRVDSAWMFATDTEYPGGEGRSAALFRTFVEKSTLHLARCLEG
jgi:hypothetical protein